MNECDFSGRAVWAATKVNMLVFLTVYALIYAGMQAAVLWRLRWLWTPSKTAWLIAVLVCGLMILAPIAARMLETTGRMNAARVVAWIGYIWLGFMFVALTLAAASWLAEGAWWAVGRAAGHAWRLPPRIVALACLGVTAAVMVYGFFEARSIQVERVTVETAKRTEGAEPIRIAQITDLHLGLMTQPSYVDRVLARLAELKPDLIVSTGDFVDGADGAVGSLARRFAALDPPLGKYAILGNHEMYAGRAWSMDFLRRCGFIVLDNRMVVLADGIELAGVDDPAMGSETADVAVLSAAEPGSFTILLKHRPYINHQATPRFDLQLSGHTHNGQIFPFNFITDAVHPHPIGRQQIDDRTVLYTSRGTGTWGPPIRVLAPPELTLIEIKGKTG